MHDILGQVEQIRRPRLLIRAARIGAQDYHREGCLRSLLGAGLPQRGAAALRHLLDIESELDAQRRMADARYSVARHLEVLIALIGEARLLRAALR